MLTPQAYEPRQFSKVAVIHRYKQAVWLEHYWRPRWYHSSPCRFVWWCLDTQIWAEHLLITERTVLLKDQIWETSPVKVCLQFEQSLSTLSARWTRWATEMPQGVYNGLTLTAVACCVTIATTWYRRWFYLMCILWIIHQQRPGGKLKLYILIAQSTFTLVSTTCYIILSYCHYRYFKLQSYWSAHPEIVVGG